MRRAPYANDARLAELRAQLQPEARQLLAELGVVRLATATQLQRLLGVHSAAEVRACRRLLARLTDWAVVARLDRRIGGQASGSSGYVYALGLSGQRLLLADDDRRPRTPWTPRPTWLRHALTVTELYVVLREAAQRGRLQLTTFQAEPACWRPFVGADGAAHTLKPDAYLESEADGFEQRHFIEVDLGTEGPGALARKLTFAGDYAATCAPGDLLPLTLWLVPDEERRRVVLRVAARLPPNVQRLHEVVTFAHAVPALTGDHQNVSGEERS